MKDAQLLLRNERLDAAANRAYYVIFHSAQAALETTKSARPKSHSGVRSQFGIRFVKEGPIESRFAKILRDASELRIDRDYDVFFEVESDRVRQLVRDAEEFQVRIKEFLHQRLG